jgi:hypothetical protein
MTEDTILLEKSGGVARITLNRPALRNARFPDAKAGIGPASVHTCQVLPDFRAAGLGCPPTATQVSTNDRSCEQWHFRGRLMKRGKHRRT